MKKLTFIIAISLVLLYSCSNEFVLTEDWKDITIVHGLLDASDTAQYIRVEKAFLDENTSAYILAQEADSLFYKNVTVTLQEIPQSGGSGGSFNVLTRVDANLEGYQKESGIFATSPNYVYKFNGTLKPTSTYKIIVERADGEKVEATTGVIGNFGVTFPLTDYKMRFASGREQQFRWNSDTDAASYDVVLRIHYTEAPANNLTNTTNKFLDWVMFENVQKTGTGLVLQTVDGAEFYKFMQGKLEVGDFARELLTMDLLVYAGGEELNNYINAGLVSSGLTSAETLPTYTNISNGLGVFSTRYTEKVIGLEALSTVKDTLRLGPYTKDLGFQ